MVSEEARDLESLYRDWSERFEENPDMSLTSMREMMETMHLATAEPEDVTYGEVDADGVPAIWCIPEDCEPDRVVLYFHGGGYVGGSMHSHRKLAGHIAKAAGGRALVIDYRLAPENPHPAPCEDAVTAFRWLIDGGIKSQHIATAGDSAGGGLCTTMVLKLREDGEPLPSAVMPISPWYDMEMKGDSMETNASLDFAVQKERIEEMVKMFLGDGSRTDPLANPLYADLTGFPPVLIHVGGVETLLDDSRRFATRAEEAGVDVTVEIEPEMQHVFPILAGRAPEANQAVERMAEWVRPKLSLT